jgi:predicted esterase
MIKNIRIQTHEGQRKGCVIALPGRNVTGEAMAGLCYHLNLPCTTIVVLEPNKLEWYPPPNGVHDQAQAVKGIDAAVKAINGTISRIQRGFRFKRSQIALVGVSAGSVMAIQVAAASDKPFAAVCAMAGAILEPDKLPKAKNQTPILLRHAYNDNCFTWEERYLPMKKALTDKGYNIFVSEKAEGAHNVSAHDAYVLGQFARRRLGYIDKTPDDDDD